MNPTTHADMLSLFGASIRNAILCSRLSTSMLVKTRGAVDVKKEYLTVSEKTNEQQFPKRQSTIPNISNAVTMHETPRTSPYLPLAIMIQPPAPSNLCRDMSKETPAMLPPAPKQGSNMPGCDAMAIRINQPAVSTSQSPNLSTASDMQPPANTSLLPLVSFAVPILEQDVRKSPFPNSSAASDMQKPGNTKLFPLVSIEIPILQPDARTSGPVVRSGANNINPCSSCCKLFT